MKWITALVIWLAAYGTLITEGLGIYAGMRFLVQKREDVEER